MFHPTRGGTRGGADQFSWEDVKNDKHRENYLGHSLMAPVGRWQKGKDLTWYAKESADDTKTKARADELARIKEAEAEAMGIALGVRKKKTLESHVTEDDLKHALNKDDDSDDGQTVGVTEKGLGFGKSSRLPPGATGSNAVEVMNHSSRSFAPSATVKTEVDEEEERRDKKKKSHKKSHKHKSSKKRRHRHHHSDDESDREEKRSRRDDRSRHHRSSRERRRRSYSPDERRGRKRDDRDRSPEKSDKHSSRYADRSSRYRSRSPSRDTTRRRSRSPSRDTTRRRSRSPSPDTTRRRGRSPSPDTTRRRGRSPSPETTRRRERRRSRSPSPVLAKKERSLSPYSKRALNTRML